MKRWKTGVPGTGFMGRIHLETIRRLGNVKIVALASLQDDVAHPWAAQFSAARVESDYRLRTPGNCLQNRLLHHTGRNRRSPQGAELPAFYRTSHPGTYHEVPIAAEDFGAVVFRMAERTRGAMTVSQVSAGRENRLSIEIHGTRRGVSWDPEIPNLVWRGIRNSNNRLPVKDPSLLLRRLAAAHNPASGNGKPYSARPGGRPGAGKVTISC